MTERLRGVPLPAAVALLLLPIVRTFIAPGGGSSGNRNRRFNAVTLLAVAAWSRVARRRPRSAQPELCRLPPDQRREKPVGHQAEAVAPGWYAIEIVTVPKQPCGQAGNSHRPDTRDPGAVAQEGKMSARRKAKGWSVLSAEASDNCLGDVAALMLSRLCRRRHGHPCHRVECPGRIADDERLGVARTPQVIVDNHRAILCMLDR